MALQNKAGNVFAQGIFAQLKPDFIFRCCPLIFAQISGWVYGAKMLKIFAGSGF